MKTVNTRQKNLLIRRPNEKLTLHTDVVTRDFTIIDNNEPGKRYYAAGGSAVCYDAKYYENGTWNYGKLKEIRTYDVFLTNEEETEPYIRSYRRLQKLVSEDSARSQVYTFVPRFDIYQSDSGSYYIWTDAKPMRTFDELYKKFWADAEHTEDALAQIVATLKSLTESIRILHIQSLIHGDIKPTNFGFYLRDGKPLIDAISLFDLDTLHGTGEDPRAFTPPYYIDSAKEDNRRNFCDIRAIGATLCKALGMTDGAIADVMQRKDSSPWSSVRNMVFGTEYFAVKGFPVDAKVQEKIVQIICETVTTNSQHRIKSCTLLSQEFQTLETMFLPYITREELSRGYGLEIVNRELRRKGQLRSVLQYHLYENPLYNSAWGLDGEYVVGLMGFGLDAQQFLDVCLEVAQSMKERIRVVVWDGPELTLEKAQYLSERPSFETFFNVNVNAMQSDMEDAYASVEFVSINGSTTGERARQAVLSLPKLLSPVDSDHVRYIYIAYGSDKDNKDMAQAFAEQFPKASVTAQRNFGESRTEGRIHYLRVEDNPQCFNGAVGIERMAFNAHLLWTGTLNADLADKRESFKDPYNHRSSVSAILGIKYRLHLMDPEFDLPLDDHDIAIRADEVIQSIQGCEPHFINELAAREHRRWVVEKVCDGWTSMSVEESLFFNKTNDRTTKRHTCLVKSDPTMPLQADPWHRREQWDSADEMALEKLDELDRMSVTLHQAYKKRADSFVLDSLLDHRMQEDILSDIEGDINLRRLFQEWYELLVDLFFRANSGVGPIDQAISEIQAYERAFKKLMATLDSSAWEHNSKRAIVKSNLNMMHDRFVPIIFSLMCHDYKTDDLDLVNDIPFILAYDTTCLMVVLADYQALIQPWQKVEDPTELFSYVAAATVVNPEKLYLPYVVPTNVAEGDKSLIDQKRRAFVEYMKRKGLQTEIELLPCENIEQTMLELSQRDEVSDRWVCIDACIEPLLDYVVVEQLTNACHAGFFSFDMDTQRFNTDNTISWLSFVEHNVSITSRDIATFLGRKAEIAMQPFMRGRDIQTLFDIYQGKVDIYGGEDDRLYEGTQGWKAMCKTLEANQFEKVMSIVNTEEATDHRYFLPYECFTAANAIVNLLKAFPKALPFANGDSRVERYSMNECLVVINGYRGRVDDLNKLFMMPYFLMAARDFSIGEEICGATVRYRAGTVIEPDIPKEFYLGSGSRINADSVIEYMVEKGYISVDSHTEGVRPWKCKAVIRGYTAEWGELNRLFTDATLKNGGGIGNPKWLLCDSLSEKQIKIMNLEGNAATGDLLVDVRTLFRTLHEKGFIRKLQYRKGTSPHIEEYWNITFGSHEIKRLLTKEGNILEYYTYFKLKNDPIYSDVVTSITFRRPDDSNAENEIDCFITRGMKTLLVECKANTFKPTEGNAASRLGDIKREFERKVRKFGINGKGLLIVDSDFLPDVADPENIITIHMSADIARMDEIIRNLLN